MIKANQPGKPTYKRDKIMWVFEPEKADDLHVKILKTFKEKYGVPINLGQIDFNERYFSFNVDKYIIYVACYGDGWHIVLSKWDGISVSALHKEKIFGDINTDSMWTQETDKVVDMMGELYMELKNET